MVRIRTKLQLIGVTVSIALSGLCTACEDTIGNPAPTPNGKTVKVDLLIGFDEAEEGYLRADASRTAAPGKNAFRLEGIPAVNTRAEATRPDALYKLEIRQYKEDGTYLNGYGPADQALGQKLTVELTEARGCQLVLVAWGQNSDRSLGSKNLAAAQAVSIDAAVINAIPADQMNAMPYVLHLKQVDVTGSGADGVISNPEGKDVRLLLKRLAARLNISWDYQVSDYTLSQILLQSIPLDYKVVAAPDEQANQTYPSLLDQYTTLRLSDEEIARGSYSCWIPANVRGVNTAATSPQYRTKTNAPIGSAYASFIAVNRADPKKKLNYRVYLGGEDYSDFNLYENTDYNYHVRFSHRGIPTDDYRVTYIDPKPASENNENFVPTANCFMVAPGSAFCFDPFMFRQDGKDIENETLSGWAASNGEGGIASVKLLWQTKENGDIGEPVMGSVNMDDPDDLSKDDHTNIVDMKKNNGDEVSALSPLTGKGQGRIYCSVAPNTTGGSGLIAAYNVKNEIIWSWHIWVTDYHPDATGNADVAWPDAKRKQKYSRSDLPGQLPVMDRNLGALAGFTTVPSTQLERFQTNGFHYQWGRKDPFRSCYSSGNITDVTVPRPNLLPVKGILSLYGPDGINYLPVDITAKTGTYRNAYQAPLVMYKSNGSNWNTGESIQRDAWGGETGHLKGIHDPCPAGWRICSIENYKPLFTDQNYNALQMSSGADPWADGGYQVVYDQTTNRSTYIRLNGYWLGINTFSYIGGVAYYWPREQGEMLRLDLKRSSPPVTNLNGTFYYKEAMPVRCIQERAE